MIERDKKTISILYDTTCESYDELYGGEQYEKYRIIHEELNVENPSFIYWLDLGCGTGLLLKYICDKVGWLPQRLYYIGIDLSYNCIKKALNKKGKIISDFIVADAERPPIRINQFNVITSFTTIHHYEDPGESVISYIKNSTATVIVTILKREEKLEEIIMKIRRYVDSREELALDIIEIGKDIGIIIKRS